jgi:hypothetical protein
MWDTTVGEFFLFCEEHNVPIEFLLLPVFLFTFIPATAIKLVTQLSTPTLEIACGMYLFLLQFLFFYRLSLT